MVDLKVSILCLAYNHEAYIQQALESFLMQKVDFEYEIIINDDCSVDKTSSIIKQYAEQFPNIIKPIFQKENQYSKGINIIGEILIPQAKGKFFALCEGDDYWIDKYKLQRQVDYLESHPDCALCIHNAERIYEDGKFQRHWDVVKKSGEISCEEVIIGGGGFCPTNSIMGPISIVRKLPSYFNIAAFDYAWQIYLASQGTTYCFKERMSAYRVAAKNSWTSCMAQSSIEVQVAHDERMINLRHAFDKENNYKYHDAIEKSILPILFDKCVLLRNFSMMKEEPLKIYVKKLSAKKKIKLFLMKYFPTIKL